MVDPTRVTRWDPVLGRGVRATLRMALWLAGVVAALLASVPAVAQATDPAAKYDQASQSTYVEHQVFTGPYMIKGANTGTVQAQRYISNKILGLVRIPRRSWRASHRRRHAR